MDIIWLKIKKTKTGCQFTLKNQITNLTSVFSKNAFKKAFFMLLGFHINGIRGTQAQNWPYGPLQSLMKGNKYGHAERKQG